MEPSPRPRLSGHLEGGPCSAASSFNAKGGSQGSQGSSSSRKKGHQMSSAAVVEEATAGAGPSSPLRTPSTNASAAASPRGLPIAMMMERPQSPRVPAPQLREPEETASSKSPQRAMSKAAAEAAQLHRYRGYEAEAEEDHHHPEVAQQGSAAADKAASSPAGVDKQPKAETLELQLAADEQARVPPPPPLPPPSSFPSSLALSLPSLLPSYSFSGCFSFPL